MNPFQNPYEQILRKTLSRVRGVERMGGAPMPQRPSTHIPLSQARGRPSPSGPYQMNLGRPGYGEAIKTEVTY